MILNVITDDLTHCTLENILSEMENEDKRL